MIQSEASALSCCICSSRARRRLGKHSRRAAGEGKHMKRERNTRGTGYDRKRHSSSECGKPHQKKSQNGKQLRTSLPLLVPRNLLLHDLKHAGALSESHVVIDGLLVRPTVGKQNKYTEIISSLKDKGLSRSQTRERRTHQVASAALLDVLLLAVPDLELAFASNGCLSNV